MKAEETYRPWLNFHAGKVIEYYAFIDDPLTLAEQVALRTLADVTSSRKGDWYGSQRKLANRVGVNRNTWARAIRGLTDRGVIERYAVRHGSKPARYSIMPWLYAGQVTLWPPAWWNPEGTRHGAYESAFASDTAPALVPVVDDAPVALTNEYHSSTEPLPDRSPDVLVTPAGQESDFLAHDTSHLDPPARHITNKEPEILNPSPYGATKPSPPTSAQTNLDLPPGERKRRSLQALIATEAEKTAIDFEEGTVHG